MKPLPVVRAADLARQTPDERWLIRDMWSLAAQGVVGGAPKSCKSWLGLDMAVSVASGTDCLGRFAVEQPGPSLVYLAEDAEPAVRTRIEAICLHRGLPLDRLDLHVITSPVLRLDRPADQQRLEETVRRHQPRLLVLDPLVRLHQVDENSAQEISRLLGALTALSRRHEVAIIVVHLSAKKHRSRPGQALRGSSDLHAWGASNAYLSRTKAGLRLTLEHREARPPDPMPLKLVRPDDGTATHLAVVDRLAATDLAAALTYTRNAFGNDTGDTVQPQDIARIKNG